MKLKVQLVICADDGDEGQVQEVGTLRGSLSSPAAPRAARSSTAPDYETGSFRLPRSSMRIERVQCRKVLQRC